MATLAPGGALINHQVALLEGKECWMSLVCGGLGPDSIENKVETHIMDSRRN